MAGDIEGKIQGESMTLLAAHPLVVYAVVNTSGKIKGRGGHWMSLGFSGLSDITGMLRGGRAFAIEVKQPGEEPTEDQGRFLQLVRQGGGLAGWIDAPHKIYDIIGEPI